MLHFMGCSPYQRRSLVVAFFCSSSSRSKTTHCMSARHTSWQEEQDAKLEKLLDDHPEPDLGEESSRHLVTVLLHCITRGAK